VRCFSCTQLLQQQNTSTATLVLTTKSTYCSLSAQQLSERTVPGVKQLGYAVDPSPPSSVEVKNEWGYITLLLNVSLWHAEAQVYCKFYLVQRGLTCDI
jgi:hypothetical protein